MLIQPTAESQLPIILDDVKSSALVTRCVSELSNRTRATAFSIVWIPRQPWWA